MTYQAETKRPVCFVNCGLPGDQCACYREMMERVRDFSDCRFSLLTPKEQVEEALR